MLMNYCEIFFGNLVLVYLFRYIFWATTEYYENNA